MNTKYFKYKFYNKLTPQQEVTTELKNMIIGNIKSAQARHAIVFIAFCIAYTCSRLLALITWTPVDALYFSCSLLVPRRYWPTLLLANSISRIPWVYLCIPEYGLLGATLGIIPFISIFMLLTHLLKNQLYDQKSKKLDLIPMTGPRLKVFFKYTLASSLFSCAYSTILYTLTFKPSLIAAPDIGLKLIIKLAPIYLLGSYAGSLALVPFILLAHQTISNADTWKTLIQQLNKNRILWSGISLGIAEVGTLIALRTWMAGDIWRQMVMLTPVAWMTMKYGWKGTAVGSTTLMACILTVMPFDGYSTNTILAMAFMAFTITALFPLGAKISDLNDQEHQSSLDRLFALRASEAKSQFLATLSHEIRTPMTGVIGTAELLQATPLTLLQRDYVTTMQRSGTLLLKLVNDALDLARIEAGHLKLEATRFDPHELIREVVQLDTGVAVTKGTTLRLEVIDPIPTWVYGDTARIKQVLLNLVNNALKFTEQGSVTLSMTAIESGLRFSISDTGPGISESEQARLFQRFEQGNGPQQAAGSGLGLAICRELVVAMGGHIELISKPGQGSTFHVTLPLPAAEPPAIAATDIMAPPHLYVRVMHLLLVEDDATVAAVICGLLENQGHKVKHVSHSLAALSECSLADFDAMLLDLDLPGVDGFQLTRLLRQREARTNERRLPILAVSARSGGDEELLTQEAGMDGFLRKPVSGAQLAKILAECVAEPGNPNIPPYSDQPRVQETEPALNTYSESDSKPISRQDNELLHPF